MYIVSISRTEHLNYTLNWWTCSTSWVFPSQLLYVTVPQYTGLIKPKILVILKSSFSFRLVFNTLESSDHFTFKTYSIFLFRSSLWLFTFKLQSFPVWTMFKNLLIGLPASACTAFSRYLSVTQQSQWSLKSKPEHVIPMLITLLIALYWIKDKMKILNALIRTYKIQLYLLWFLLSFLNSNLFVKHFKHIFALVSLHYPRTFFLRLFKSWTREERSIWCEPQKKFISWGGLPMVNQGPTFYK